MKTQIKTKWRLEYWQNGAKRVRVFGSQGQAKHFASELPHGVSGVTVRPLQEREIAVPR